MPLTRTSVYFGSARLFDTKVLEPVLHVLQTRGAEEFGDAEIKGIGQFFALNKVKKCPWGARLSMLT